MKILIVELIMAANINVLMSSVFGSSRGFLFGPGHFAIFSCEVLDNSGGIIFLNNHLADVNSCRGGF
jgi:hypothetical protein